MGRGGQPAPDRRRADLDEVDYDDAATRAVVAHALLTTMTAVSSSIALLRSDWHRLPEADRDRLLALADSQARLVTDLLTDMVRGLPPVVIAALSALETERHHGDSGNSV